jgi:putative transposase
MPIRSEPFLNNYIYHVFNRTIDSREIFKSDYYSNQFLQIIRYYRSGKEKMSFSYLSRLSEDERESVLRENGYQKYFRIEILAYCLMPTHFHLLILQKKDRGISTFIADSLNSFTRYYNIRNQRKGPIFLSKFKSSSVSSDALLMHISRYIHLNPYSGGLIKDINKLSDYPWSSFWDYSHGQRKNNFINQNVIMHLINHNKRKYQQFIYDQADYQKNLEMIKHAIKW